MLNKCNSTTLVQFYSFSVAVFTATLVRITSSGIYRHGIYRHFSRVLVSAAVNAAALTIIQ